LDHPECDIASTGKGRDAGSSTAAAFLEKFVEEGVEWAHLDIAGVGMLDAPQAHREKGGTGWGVQLLTKWVQENHAK